MDAHEEPAQLDFVEDPRVVIVSGRGVLSADLMLRWVAEMTAHPSFELGMHQIYDATQLDYDGLSQGEIRQTIERLRESFNMAHDRAQVAFVAPRDVIFGLGRMFEAFAEDKLEREIHVARTREDALRWIASRDGLQTDG